MKRAIAGFCDNKLSRGHDRRDGDAKRQKTCPACGKPIEESTLITLEVLFDPSVRYIVLHWNESTYIDRSDNAE